MLDLSLLPDGGAGWLDASGEHADIVISTRIRLARNLEGYAFTPRARDGERLRILTQVREAFASLRSIEDGVLLRVDELPAEDRLLPDFGCGVTNMVARASTAADELSAEELREGAIKLARKIKRYQPKWIAFVGIGAYGTGFGEKKVRVGRQDRVIGQSGVWVLPNTSGLNANYQAAELGKLFGALRGVAFSVD